jgi:hypothetical protein
LNPGLEGYVGDTSDAGTCFTESEICCMTDGAFQHPASKSWVWRLSWKTKGSGKAVLASAAAIDSIRQFEIAAGTIVDVLDSA